MAQYHVLRERVKEHAETCPDYRLPFSGYVPCGAHARSEVLLVRVVQAAQPGLSNLSERKCLRDRIERGDVTEEVVLLLHDAEIVPAQTIV